MSDTIPATGSTTRKEQSAADVLKYIPVRAVLWVLIVGLIATTGYIGRGMIGRLDSLESWKNAQNGHLKEIDRRLENVNVNVEWIKKTLEKGK